MLTVPNYTTTRENWELRLIPLGCGIWTHYTTTRENWELRPEDQRHAENSLLYHYERKLGTMTYRLVSHPGAGIIPLREKTGNYD